jgi:hypothetical protein
VQIIERDPLDPAAPVMWERTVLSQSGNDIVLTAALSSPAWDPTKKYRIIFDDFDAVITVQKTKSFQADDADGLVLDSSSPYQYVGGSGDTRYEANPATPDIELVPDICYADGAGRDTGHETALLRQIDNFIDYKSAIQMPLMWSTPLVNTGNDAYVLQAAIPIFLSTEVLSATALRELSVGIQHRSSTGASASVRITLARSKPTNNTSRVSINRGAVYSEMTRTTTSTTWQTSSNTALDCRVKDAAGMAWLLVEVGYLAEFRGFSQCSESVRTTEFTGI